MKRFGNYILLAFLAAALLSCGKEAIQEDESIISAPPSATASGDEGEAGQSSDEPAGEPSVSPKDDFVDNVDWSAYDSSRYLIGFGADSESAVRMSVADQSSDEGSRVTIDPSTMWRQWDNGDEVKVYVPASGESGLYKYDSSKKQFRPKNEENVVDLNGSLAYIYYPASIFSSYSAGVATVTMPAAVAYNSASDLGEKLPMAGLIPAGKDIASVLMVHFKNLSSIFRLSLTGCETVTSVQLSNADVPLAGSGSVTWNGSTVSAVPTLATAGGSTSMTVSCGDGVTLNESTPTEFYFLLPSSGSMSELTVTVNFTQSDETYTYTPYITKTRSTTLTLGRSQNIRYALRAGFFSGGDGSELNPYQIETPDQLNQMSQYCRQTEAYKGYNETAGRTYFSMAHYVQTAALDCSGVSFSGPIGSVTWPFYGSYDGDGYAISNYSLSTNGSYQVALFGKVHGGTIEGVRLQSASISSSNTESSTINVAGVVAYLSGGGTVDDCQSISTSVQGLKTGGVVGYVENGTVSDCQSRGVTVQSQGTYLVSDVATYGYAGGVVGGTKDATVSGCRCWGANADGTGTASSISGGGVAGGIAGYIGGASGTTSVTDAYVTNASITTTGNYAGGAIGNIYGGGSLTGRTGDGSSLTVKDASVTAANYAGGLVGRNTGTIRGTKYGTNNINYTALTYRVTVNATNYAGGLCGINENAGMLDCCYANGNTVTASNTYAGGLCGTATGTRTLTDCLARGSTIKAYDGVSTYGNYVGGLFGYLGASTGLDCSDLTADNGYNNTIDGNGYVGGVCGYQLGPVTGHTSYPMCAKSTITARSDYLGGISGRCEANVTNCLVGKSSNAVTLSGTRLIGGVVGSINADDVTLSSCGVSYTSISASNGYAGGVAGTTYNTATVTGCSSDGISFSTAGNSYGGILGSVATGGDATVTDCPVSNLTVTKSSGSNVGGVVGYVAGALALSGSNVTGIDINMTGGTSGVGGVVGRIGDGDKVGSATISGCSVAGTRVSAPMTAVGGVVGLAYCSENLSVFNCVNTVPVSGTTYVGGILGRLIGGNVEQCRNKASVTATGAYAGGIAGLMNGGTIQTCYAANRDASNVETCVQGSYGVGGLVGYVNSNVSKAVVINCAARTCVTSTGYTTGNDCQTGGLVGCLNSNSYSSTAKMAVIYNSVAFDKLIQNTSATATVNIAAVVGSITTDDSVSSKTYAVVRNCYAQVMNSNLKYMNGTQCPTTANAQYGGIFGQLVKGTVRDCYYRCTAAGKIESNGSQKNYTQITGAAKNGTEEIASLTLYTGRELPGDLVEHLYLVDAMTQGSYTGKTGTTPVETELSRGNPKANFSEWVTYTSSSNYFAVPKVLYDLGADYYKN